MTGEGKTLSVWDLDDLLRDLWGKHDTNPLKTITIHPDGYHEAGEPDVDDVPLAEGDVVAWSVLRSSLFRDQPLPERIPYLLGVVRQVESPDEDLAGMVAVRFTNGAGGWKERSQLRKMPEDA